MNPKFDMEYADELVGKHVIIDLIIHDYDESFLERKQMHGVIVRASESQGIVVKLHSSGHEYMLPPDIDEFRELPPGPYTLESTGEVVENADLATSILVHLPPPEYEGPVHNQADIDPTGKSGPVDKENAPKA
jgi:hypothetical protein